MRWRLLRLNWAYGIGELCIIVVGVMIALGFEQWNSDRLDRVEEAEIIDRFIADLREDLEDVSNGLNLVAAKQERLERIYTALGPPIKRPTDEAGFLNDVASAAVYGWVQARARRTTFDEVLASGRFGLIRSTAIRVQIADYYSGDIGIGDRIDERETQYPDLSYSLVPRRDEQTSAAGLSEEQIRLLVDEIFSTLRPSQVIAERNFARFVAEMFTVWQDRCLRLIDALEAYRDSLG